MASFLDTHGIANALNQVITKAEKAIVLISPYISFPPILFERLLDADERGVLITIVYGKAMLKNKEIEHLAQLDNLRLLYLDNLHAKCYFNENTMVISSMNLYDYSEKNNREMGILLTRDKDDNIIRDAVKECNSIISASESIVEPKPKHKSNKGYTYNNKSSKAPQGHCIRCDASIALNPSAPYCKECYTSWNNYKNPNYREKHCHSCGKKTPATMHDPLCMQC